MVHVCYELILVLYTDIAQSEQEKEPPDASYRESVLKTIAGYIIVTEFCEVLSWLFLK